MNLDNLITVLPSWDKTKGDGVAYTWLNALYKC
nr:MAG TPA: hypothetical protein [Caudoviricetes sp.]DAQ20462.1 MAG TPA: hypothetical protein [Caudoviricetes sp.]